jgi:hypothetical protein
MNQAGSMLPRKKSAKIAKQSVPRWKGSSDLNPWLLSSVSFLGDDHNLRLMMQAPNGDLAPAWATEYQQTLEGVTLKLNPSRYRQAHPGLWL